MFNSLQIFMGQITSLSLTRQTCPHPSNNFWFVYKFISQETTLSQVCAVLCLNQQVRDCYVFKCGALTFMKHFSHVSRVKGTLILYIKFMNIYFHQKKHIHVIAFR